MNNQGGSDNQQISFSVDGQVATIRIDRAEKKNALTHQMWRQITALFERIGIDPSVRCAVITGTGADFCAGADINEFEAVRRDAVTAKDYETANDDAFAAIRDCEIPVIAAIRGVCYGGGFGIAAATDIRFGTPSALFSVPAAKLGLAYPALAMADIVNAVGSQMARYLTFSSERIDAEQALAAGFLNEIIEEQELDKRVADLAHEIAANAPLSVKASKASIRAALSGSKGDLAHAEKLGKATFDSDDYAEGRAAFAEKRKPVFTGK